MHKQNKTKKQKQILTSDKAKETKGRRESLSQGNMAEQYRKTSGTLLWPAHERTTVHTKTYTMHTRTQCTFQLQKGILTFRLCL